MGKIGQLARRILYRTLPLESYLKVLSGLFLFYYRRGWMRESPAYEYPYFLSHLVRSGDTVLDIGANLGYYAYIFSRIVGDQGKVYAVEPVKPIRSVLQHNLKGRENVEILGYALGREEQRITMGNDSIHVGGYLGTGQNFVMESSEAVDITFEAEMKRGSVLFGALQRIDFIKCDIEGYERIVLTEMEPLIAQHHPIILLETGGENRPFMVEFLAQHGYKPFVLDQKRMRALTSEDGKDIIFIPTERMKGVEKWIKQ